MGRPQTKGFSEYPLSTAHAQFARLEELTQAYGETEVLYMSADIEKAYNSVDIYLLIQLLEDSDLPDELKEDYIYLLRMYICLKT